MASPAMMAGPTYSSIPARMQSVSPMAAGMQTASPVPFGAAPPLGYATPVFVSTVPTIVSTVHRYLQGNWQHLEVSGWVRYVCQSCHVGIAQQTTGIIMPSGTCVQGLSIA
jgi:hypothetical protein